MKFSFVFTLFLLLAALVGHSRTRANDNSEIVLDVRTPHEYSEKRVKGALNIDFLNSSFENKVQNLDKNQNYKVYCRTGNRSGKAIAKMKTLGFSGLENLGSVDQALQALKAQCEGPAC